MVFLRISVPEGSEDGGLYAFVSLGAGSFHKSSSDLLDFDVSATILARSLSISRVPTMDSGSSSIRTLLEANEFEVLNGVPQLGQNFGLLIS